jgi:hypothetical protein
LKTALVTDDLGHLTCAEGATAEKHQKTCPFKEDFHGPKRLRGYLAANPIIFMQ